jgi:hypothetical protein
MAQPRDSELATPATEPLGRLGAVAWSVAALAAIGVVAHRVIPDDQWWHIATGRLILARGSIPDTDPFSFTFYGERWINWEWLFGVIAALTWDQFGIWGLYGLRVLTTGVCVAATAVHMLRHSTQTARSFGLLVLTLLLLCMQYRTGDRPHTIGFALLAASFLFARGWLETRSWSRTLALFGVFLVWANTHPSFAYGLLVLGCLAIDSTVDDVLAVRAGSETAARARTHARARFVQLAVIGASALGIPHAFEHLRRVRTTLADPVSSEWTSIALHATHGHPWMYAFLTLLALLLASLAIDRRLRRSSLTLLLAAFAILAFVYSRFVVEFAIVASVVVYRSCLPVALRLEARVPVRPSLVHGLLGLRALVAIEAETRNTYGELAFGMDTLGNPVTQADFMRAQGMRGRVFAPGRGDSAYLTFRLWPAVRIFIDGRVPQVYPLAFAELHARIAAEPRVFADVVARYDIDHVVLDRGTFSEFGREWGDRLEQLGGFVLVYFDERGMLWTRDRRAGLACASCRALRYLKPWRTDHDWIVREFPKQPFEETWSELAYAMRTTRGDAVVRALISTLIEAGGATEAQRERLKSLLMEPAVVASTKRLANEAR